MTQPIGGSVAVAKGAEKGGIGGGGGGGGNEMWHKEPILLYAYV